MMRIHDRPALSGDNIVYVARKLLRLFEQGGGKRRAHYVDALPLAIPFLLGSVRLRLSRIPVSILRRAERESRRPGFYGESGAHLWMKAAALLWMRGQGARDAREEVTCFAGRADVYSEKRAWAVEVGNNSVRKLENLIHARRGNPACRLTIVPYQRVGEDLSRGLLAIDFDTTPEAASDLRKYHFAMVDGVIGSANGGKRPKGCHPIPSLTLGAGFAIAGGL